MTNASCRKLRSLRQIIKQMQKEHRCWLQADAKAIFHSSWENRLLVIHVTNCTYIASQVFSLLSQKPLYYLCDWGCFSPYSFALGKVNPCIPKGVEAAITSAACGNKATFQFYSGSKPTEMLASGCKFYRIASQAKRFKNMKIIPCSH